MQREIRFIGMTFLAGSALTVALVGCGRSEKVVYIEAEPTEAVGQRSGSDDQSGLTERENELARREAELAARESEFANQKQQPTAVPPAPTPASILVTLPTGSLVTVEFAETLSSHESTVGQKFTARVVEPVMVPEGTAIPVGSVVAGKVTEAKPAKKIGGTSRLAVEFTSVRFPSGESVPFKAAFSSKGKSSTGRDVGIIVGATAGGAIIGHQLGSKGAGGLVGAAAGAVAASQTRAKPVVIEAGTVTNLELIQPVNLKL